MPSTFLPLKALSFYTSQLVLWNANSNITTLNVSRIGSQSSRYILTICLPSVQLVRDWCCWQNVEYYAKLFFVFFKVWTTLMMHIFSIVLVLRIAESQQFTMCNTNTRLFHKWRWHHFLWGLSFFSFASHNCRVHFILPTYYSAEKTVLLECILGCVIPSCHQ